MLLGMYYIIPPELVLAILIAVAVMLVVFVSFAGYLVWMYCSRK